MEEFLDYKSIPIRDKDSLFNALRAGVTPRVGAKYIQVGRNAELCSCLNDMERIKAGAASFRLLIGDYGAGKTFFINMIRGEAISQQFVVAHADLTPTRRLYGTNGESRSLYAELMKNISIRTKPEGGALNVIVEKFISTALSEARKTGQSLNKIIQDKLEQLTELVLGYAFATVISEYWRAYESGDDHLKADCIRWLRGEFATKSDAKSALGVREIVSDSNMYDQLKLIAKFCRVSGYSGFVICLDEMVNLYKIAHSQSRGKNYEQILRILNDLEQGNAEGIGFILSGTPEFLFDQRRGLYCYPALQTRLAENPFVRDGVVDLSGPVLHLNNLSREQFVDLLHKLYSIFIDGKRDSFGLSSEIISAFMEYCEGYIGAATFRTPRTTIKSFLGLLSVLEQNQDSDWRLLLNATPVVADSESVTLNAESDLVSIEI